MKTQILAALALIVAAQTAHATDIMPLLSCASADTGPDHGTQVHITQNSGPITAVGAHSSLYATITEETIAGPQNLEGYEVVESQAHGMGAPKLYTGKDFSLELDVDGAPVNGKTYATLSAEFHGQRISEVVYCRSAESL